MDPVKNEINLRKVFPVATNEVTSLVTEKLKVVNGLQNQYNHQNL
jgi:hypothetical protein